jgi:hypothetical protein
VAVSENLEPAEVIGLRPDGPPTRIEGVPEESEYLVGAGIAKGTTLDSVGP